MPAFYTRAVPARAKMGFLLLILLTLIYFAINIVAGQLVGGFWGSYVLTPILWLLLAFVVFFLYPPARPEAKLRHRRFVYWASFFCALAGVAAVFSAGIVEGFAKSPYDHSFLGIIINIIYLGSMLAGMELSRAWLMNSLFKNKSDLGVAVIAIYFTVFTFLPRFLNVFEDSMAGVQFAGSTILPALAENMLACYLAFLGGPLSAIIYRGTLLSFQWFFPVIPNLSWIMQALIGTFIPTFCMIFLYRYYRFEIMKAKRKREKESLGGWVAISVVSIIVIWFAAGVFSVYPNVIITGSMVPKIEVGDVVIVQRIEPEKVELGDVIQFRKGRVRVNHRVVEITIDENGQPLFVTKGDANDAVDSDPVFSEQLEGKVVQVVPRIGWITIWLRRQG